MVSRCTLDVKGGLSIRHFFGVSFVKDQQGKEIVFKKAWYEPEDFTLFNDTVLEPLS